MIGRADEPRSPESPAVQTDSAYIDADGRLGEHATPHDGGGMSARTDRRESQAVAEWRPRGRPTVLRVQQVQGSVRASDPDPVVGGAVRYIRSLSSKSDPGHCALVGGHRGHAGPNPIGTSERAYSLSVGPHLEERARTVVGQRDALPVWIPGGVVKLIPIRFAEGDLPHSAVLRVQQPQSRPPIGDAGERDPVRCTTPVGSGRADVRVTEQETGRPSGRRDRPELPGAEVRILGCPGIVRGRSSHVDDVISGWRGTRSGVYEPGIVHQESEARAEQPSPRLAADHELGEHHSPESKEIASVEDRDRAAAPGNACA